ncbi:MAG: RNA pyrophosphohydrolase [Chitinivibrionales bacterium]|nr:RNA pyrophosphohydrolase [Chitinivibrionales bacterium]MBD3395115.1 RNA pyrophosphohydrolase [Chitinivibrionales bacterium]
MSYRDSVCVVIRQPGTDRVLVCHRAGYPSAQGWQFPQGGRDPEKGLLDEARRELREEIGTDAVEFVATAPGDYTYDFPEKARTSRPRYRGQRQRWVLAEFRGSEADISFSHEPAEFDRWEWVEPPEAFARVVDFKKDVYRDALKELGLL